MLFSAENQSASFIKVSDVTGKVITINPINIRQGENKLKVDIEGLSEGLYFIEIMSNEKNRVKKFVKQ